MSFHFFIITTSNELRPCRVASMSLISQYILVFQVMCIYKLFTAALIFFFFCTYVVTSYFIKTVMLNSMDTLLPQPNARVCTHTCTFRFDHCKLIWNRFLCPPSEFSQKRRHTVYHGLFLSTCDQDPTRDHL